MSFVCATLRFNILTVQDNKIVPHDGEPHSAIYDLITEVISIYCETLYIIVYPNKKKRIIRGTHKANYGAT